MLRLKDQSIPRQLAEEEVAEAVVKSGESPDLFAPAADGPRASYPGEDTEAGLESVKEASEELLDLLGIPEDQRRNGGPPPPRS